jgi:hypothetical protein
MPRDSLDLADQHAALLNKREEGKKRTRLRNRVPDDWKSDKVYPQDKPASYTPRSPGRDVLCGGYRRSEYQIEVHSRDYVKRVVSRRENHRVKEGDNHVARTEKKRNGLEEGEKLPQSVSASQRRKSHGRTDSKPEKNSESRTLADFK